MYFLLVYEKASKKLNESKIVSLKDSLQKTNEKFKQQADGGSKSVHLPDLDCSNCAFLLPSSP